MTKLTNRLIFVLALAGLMISSYLFYTYVAAKPIICLNTGCEIVRDSKYSYLLGIPIPAYGAILYLAILAGSFARTVVAEHLQKILTRSLFGLTLAGLAVSGYLTYLEAFKIKAYCMWCLTSAAITLLLFIISSWEFKEANEIKR